MTGADTAVYYLAPEPSKTLEDQLKDAIDGAAPECLLYSQRASGFGCDFAMQKTLREKLETCNARNILVVWDTYLTSGFPLAAFVQKYESENLQHVGHVLIHRAGNGKESILQFCEWCSRIDCSMDFVVGEVTVLMNSYKKVEVI